jgi:ammonia channel protein AmtB
MLCWAALSGKTVSDQNQTAAGQSLRKGGSVHGVVAITAKAKLQGRISAVAKSAVAAAAQHFIMPS